MLIVDAHLDIAWNALQWNRNLLQSVYTIRTQEVEMPGAGRAQNTVALPEMCRGRVALCFATILARSTGIRDPLLDYGSPAQAYGIGQGQLAYYRALESEGHIRIIQDLAALNRHIAEWQAWDERIAGDTKDAPPLGFVISLESADSILSPEQLNEWYKAGLRVAGPAHYGPGRYSGGTGTELGLTEIGSTLLAEMETLHMILDLTHFSDRAFWQALASFHGAVLASHSNCRAIVPHQRQLSDEQLRAIIERDGVVGSVFEIWMLTPEWNAQKSSNKQASIESVVDHIDHICQIAGDSAHAAIGSDLDGGFGRESSPHDLDTIADLQQLAPQLAKRGYVDADIAAIMNGNWLRLLRRAWAR